jgi:hypothetical protein
MSEKLVIIDGAVDTAVIAEYEATRREAVRRGIVLGGAVIAATAGPTLLRVGTEFAQSDGDAILKAAVGLEQTAVVAYDAAVGSGLLDARSSPSRSCSATTSRSMWTASARHSTRSAA